jgi:hypothetical protein
MHGRNGADTLLLMIEEKMKTVSTNKLLKTVFDLIEVFLASNASNISFEPQVNGLQENLFEAEVSLEDRISLTYLVFSILHDWNVYKSGFFGRTRDQQTINFSSAYMEVREHLFGLAKRMSIAFDWDKSYVSTRGLNSVLDLYSNRTISLHNASLISDGKKQEILSPMKALRNKVPKNEDPSDARANFLKFIISCFSDKLGFKELEFLEITPEDFLAAKNYLYTLRLLVDCKQSAVRISADTWDDIESKILR